MTFTRVRVLDSCIPGLDFHPGELVIWFDGSRKEDPVYLLYNVGWVEWLPGTTIAETLANG
jgi:hypothetical protein